MSTESSTPDIHLPFALLALAIVVLLASQVGAASQSSSIMRWQIDTLQKQITNMEATDKQAADAIKNREDTVKKSGEIQNQLQSLLNDVLDLAKDDKDAQEIIKKYGVQRNQPTPPATGAEAAKPAEPPKKTPTEPPKKTP